MTAPAELASIGLDASRFRRATPTEFKGPCPFCGGTDRFRVHTDRPFPHWFCVCREGTGCGWKGWADQINPALREPMTDEKRRQYAQQAAEQEQARERARIARLAEFTDSEIYQECHRRMTAANRQWWEAQGIPPSGQEYWRLGYTASAMSYGPAYTIPYFSSDWNPVNMQYRLTNPPNDADKYRWAGLGYSSFFTAHPEMGPTDEIIICEGAKKAMVYTSHIELDTRQVYAVPSKSDFAGLPQVVSEAGRVWVMLDPDAEDQARKLALEIGDGARIVTLTEKADDMITKFGAGPDVFKKYFRQATKL